jgi:hypothetical protein
VVALTLCPYFAKPLVSTINDTKAAIGKTIPKDNTPEIPYRAIKPGFIIKVAALVMEAAKESPTTQDGNFIFPTAKSEMFFAFNAPLITKNKITAA